MHRTFFMTMIVASLVCASWGANSQIPDAHHAQVEMMRTDVTLFMSQKDYSTVLAKLGNFHQLVTDVPLEYLALEGKLSAETGDLPRAHKAFTEYFAKATAGEPSYAESLKISREIQPRLAAAEAQHAQAVKDAERVAAEAAKGEGKRMAATTAARARLEAAIAKRVKRIKDCAACPEMVVIPAGRFVMGDTGGKGSKDERPAHPVTIAKSFAFGRYEVTFAEWDACAAAGGCKTNPSDEGWGRGRQPVMNVSWYDAQQYVAWLTAKTGHAYRLPTDAEWEYAARAGTTTAYAWGDTVSHENANYGTEECCGGLAHGTDRWVYTSPVGSFAPNAFGLYDVHGNVREWVQDCAHDEGYDGAPANGEAWTTDCDGDFRVYRGGSWSVFPWLLRVSNRGRYAPDVTFKNLGFRVVREIDAGKN